MRTKCSWLALPLIFFFLTSHAQDLSNISDSKKLTVNGDFSIHGIGYSAKGIANRRPPTAYYFNGNITLSLLGLQLPFRFTLSDQNQNLSTPFNQFGISPSYKWITVHLGYRNICYSPYTLGGATMLGYGIDINPGKFKFGIMYGRLNKATEIDSSSGYIRPYSFERKGLAINLGVGSKRTYFDLSVLRAGDDSNSVQNKLKPSDSLAVTPAQNLSAALKFSIGLGKKMRFFGDVGYSLYTNNINSSIKLSEDVQKIVDGFKPFFILNATTDHFLAYNAGLEFESKLFSLKTGFQYVEPDFKSMGAYYFNTDIKNFTISPAFRTRKNKFRLNGSLGIQSDNVLHTKTSTTKRIIGRGNLSWMPNKKFGLDINYSNYSTNSIPQVVNINNKYILSVANQNFNVTPRYFVTGKKLSHLVMLNYNNATLRDFNNNTQSSNTITTHIGLLNYNVTILKSQTALGTSLSYSRNVVSLNETVYSSVGFSITQSLLKNKLQIGVNFSYSKANIEQTPNILTGNSVITFKPSKHHQLYFRANYLNSKNKDITLTNKDYNEGTGEIAYTYSF